MDINNSLKDLSFRVKFVAGAILVCLAAGLGLFVVDKINSRDIAYAGDVLCYANMTGVNCCPSGAAADSASCKTFLCNSAGTTCKTGETAAAEKAGKAAWNGNSFPTLDMSKMTSDSYADSAVAIPAVNNYQAAVTSQPATQTTTAAQATTAKVDAVWSNFSTCDADCGGGSQFRTCTPEKNGGKTCSQVLASLSDASDGTNRECNTQACPSNKAAKTSSTQAQSTTKTTAGSVPTYNSVASFVATLTGSPATVPGSSVDNSGSTGGQSQTTQSASGSTAAAQASNGSAAAQFAAQSGSPASKVTTTQVDKVQSASPGATTTTKPDLPNFNCSGKCDPSKTQTCAWFVGTANHCFCDNGQFKVTSDIKEYCGLCGWDTKACDCNYNGSAFAVGKIFCGIDKSQNVSFSCKTPPKTTVEACINGSVCGTKNGCGAETPACTDLTNDIIDVVGQINSGTTHFASQSKASTKFKIHASSSSNYWTDSQSLADEINNLEKKGVFENVKNSAAKLKKISGFGKLSVACASPKITPWCSEESAQVYTCAEGPLSGCYVWNWVMGGSKNCSRNSDGDYCQYTKNASTGEKIAAGACSGEAPRGCSNPAGSIGEYGCDSGTPALCSESGKWVKITTCEDAGCKAACASTVGKTCTTKDDCGSDSVCAFKDKTAATGVCAIAGQTACAGSNSRYYQPDNDVYFCSQSQYYHCVAKGYTAATWLVEKTCANGCDAAGSKCAAAGTTAQTDCSSTPRSCLAASDDCAANCGSGWTCKPKQDFSQTTLTGLGLTFTLNQVSQAGDGGVCAPASKVTPVITPSESLTVKCDSYFDATGACANCTTNKPFKSCTIKDSVSATPVSVKGSGQTSFTQCLKNAGSGDSSSSSSTKKSNQTTVTLYVDCVGDSANDKAHDETTCDGPTGPANTYNPTSAKNPDNQGAAKGEDCATDDDCTIGLVCKDGTCMTKAAAAAADKADNTAPTVSITSPTGTVKDKAADLKATTNLKATCTFSNTCGNNTVTGMTMNTSDGYSHTATLSSLSKGSCTVTVTCKNGGADTAATSATGTDTKTYTVDLSGNSEYKPTVTSATDPKFEIANPVLKVTTNLPAACQFKKDSTFTYGSGTKFDTTGTDTAGAYNHNTQLTSLTNADYTYYVVCQGTEAGANSDPLAVKFTVDLSGSAPTIESTTPATQTVTNPTLSITTNLPAACQYKKDSTFVYDDKTGTQFGNDGDYSHTVSLASYADGPYKFYVACKGDSTGAAKTYDKAIETTLSRTGAVGPTISNTTGSNQTTSTPIISITTGTAATCQYKEGADFTYGSGIQFADSSTGHSVTLPVLADGTHTFYVVCKDITSGAVNAAGTQIIFTVAAGSTTCAKLTSNDKQNDDDRNASESDDSDSVFLWKAAENGTRGEFTSVDWYAGYQFTTNKDGKVTQLCGYFASGDSNKVSLYNSSYKALATATVKGDDDWKCVNISPVAVKSDKHYYVIARVDNAPINYEYESGLLPTDGDNAVVEAGIRQLATDDFGSDIKKYDYMVFGLVDVRISFTAENSEGPEVSSPVPVGTISHDYAKLSVETDNAATCKFDRNDVEYADMAYTFGTTGAKNHEQKVCELDDGNFTWYVRCKNTSGGDVNDASTLIQFETSN